MSRELPGVLGLCLRVWGTVFPDDPCSHANQTLLVRPRSVHPRRDLEKQSVEAGARIQRLAAVINLTSKRGEEGQRLIIRLPCRPLIADEL